MKAHPSQRPKILVTGGAGYIGSHTVVELLNAGYQPVILDNFSHSFHFVPDRIAAITGHVIPLYNINCCDHQALDEVFRKEGPFQAVIHFAAFMEVADSVAFPAKYFENNIGSLATLLQVMAQHGKPGLVFSSSCTVYGQPDQLPVTEASPFQPAASPYGYTKQACERMIEDVVKSPAGLSAVVLRYFNPIGAHPTAYIGQFPHGVPNHLVPYVTEVAAGIREQLIVHGNDYNTPDGTCIRDYIHVVDLAHAHVAALRCLDRHAHEPRLHKIVNIASGQGNSVMEVIQAMEKVLGRPLNYKIGPRRPGDVEAIWATSNSEGLEGWKAELSLETALQDAWRWQERLTREKAH